METRHPRPQGQVIQDDGGLWMKVDSIPEVRSINPGEMPQDKSKITRPARSVITRCYSMMDDEGVDYVFIPPASSTIAPVLPAEGSIGAAVNNSSVTLSNGAADVTETKANPSDLDWHHGEHQLMAAQNKVDEVITGTTQTPKEFTNISLSIDKDTISLTDQDQIPMEDTGCLMEACHDSPGSHHQDNTRDGELHEQQQDILRETDAEEDKYPKENPSNIDENSDNETDSKLATENDDSCGVGTSDLETQGQPKLFKCNQNKMDSTSSQSQVSEIPVEETKDHQDHVDTGSLDYNLTKNDRVKRDSSSSETPQPSVSEGFDEGEQENGNKRISIDIQQGEELLQRLQLVQQRQEGDQGTRGEENDVFEAEADDLTPKETTPTGEEARTSLSTMSERTDSSDDDQCDKQNLQRAGGILNLADNLDVLEIPFKTNISLEPIPPQVGQRDDWQFSEQKMQKEISQEIQRELVMVNQGKIPGGYSKGEIRQLKETKLLFEAFQQGSTDGLTRAKKTSTTAIRGPVYPSVLERTRSLEIFSLKSCPVSRTNSFRLYESTTSEREQSPERLRSRSPTSRDKTRLYPYPKQDKQPRLCRSMDSIGTDISTAVDMRGKTREGHTREGSPILKHNPFFKLRPALALQPEVEKDIREAKEREEELRRQRCTLYGENRQNTQEEDEKQCAQTLIQGQSAWSL